MKFNVNGPKINTTQIIGQKMRMSGPVEMESGFDCVPGRQSNNPSRPGAGRKLVHREESQ